MIGRWRAASEARRLLKKGYEDRREGRLREAEAAFADALAAARSSGDRALLEACATRVSQSLRRQRRFDDSLAVNDELIEIRAAHFGRQHDRTIEAIEAAIGTCRQAGRPAAAEPYCRLRLAAEVEHSGRQSSRWAFAACTLGWSLREQDRLDEAAELYREALEVLETEGADHKRVGWALSGLAVLQQKLGNFDEAERMLRRARDAWDRDGETAMANGASERLIDLYLAARRPDDALVESNRFMDRVTRGQVDERVRLRRTERHARVLRAAGREAEAHRLDVRISYLRQAMKLAREEDAAARRRAGEEAEVADELAEGEMWGDPAGPVYPTRT